MRVAAALLLLYGHPISRTVQMTAAQISHANGRTYLAFGQHPVLLLPPLARLIQELHATATPTAVLGGRGGPTTWLFPGQVPGRHMSAGGLARQLNQHGIQARISRSSALISLAADLPAAVIADLLGIHINTDVRWAHRAQRDWASYLAARSASSRRSAGGPSGHPNASPGCQVTTSGSMMA